MEGGGHDLFQGTIPAIYWSGWGNTKKLQWGYW